LYAEVSTGDISVLEGDICVCDIQIRWITADSAFLPTIILDSTKYQIYQTCVRTTILHTDYADDATWQKSVQTITQDQMSGAVNGFVRRLNYFLPKTSTVKQTIKSSSR
jgi:hypothetical protein